MDATRPGGTPLDGLVARQDIWDCMLRYARGVDRLDEQLIRSAFWPDARDSHGPATGSVDDFLSYWLPTQPEREAVQHFVSNQTVWFDGDSADVETYFMASSKYVGSDTFELVAGRYLDRFESRGSEWRISSRLVVLDWQFTADASGMSERLARGHTGTRDRYDPSYQRPVGPR